MQKHLPKHLSKKSIALQSLLVKKRKNDWKNKPIGWADIRKDCPANSIALYAGHTADYSSYDNLGFTATCSDGYKVYIDGTQYGTTYASGATCSITWSSLALETGDSITTSSTLTAHKIWIEPATSGNNITRFRCKRVAGNTREYQGVLWAHFNLSSELNLQDAFGDANTSEQSNALMKACTAKDNSINLSVQTSSLNSTFADCEALEYVPVFCGAENQTGYNFYRTFRNCITLSKINFKNISAQASSSMIQVFLNCRALKKLPEINLISTTRMDDFITNDTALKDTVLDVSSSASLAKIGCYGTSTYFMTGFKGLRVSNEAPLDNATPPQVKVDYTGMDRAALVQLFNDLPTVSSGQIISIVGTTGASDLTADDELIATAKGWTITK